VCWRIERLVALLPKRPHRPDPNREVLRLFQQIIDRLDAIDRRLAIVRRVEGTIVADLSALQAEVARNTDVGTSVVTLVQKLADELEAANGDPAAIQAIVDQLRSNDDALAAAVTANTPTPTP